MSEGWTEESANEYFGVELAEQKISIFEHVGEAFHRFSHSLENFGKYGFGKATDEGLSESD